MKLNELTIKEAQEGLRKKDFSSTELLQACLQRIKEVDGRLNAFITVCEKEALKEAEKTDGVIARNPNAFNLQPLLGIPIAAKDNFCVKGVRTTAGSKILENYFPPYDATVIARLKKAGAIILGKTNMDAWAHGSSTETSQFFTTKNPWNTDFLPGGSSGGSAAAIAADETIGAIGSETAGSIRQPAAWCGVVGFKPTYGRVSRYGLIAMASSLDSPGPMTKTIEDAALILSVLSGNDKMDATTSSCPGYEYPKISGKNISGLKIGVPREYFFKEMDKKTANVVFKAIEILKKKGARLKEITMFDPKYAIAVYTILQRSEVSSNLARYDGIRYGKNRSFFGEEAKRRIMLGTHTLSAGYYDAYYLKAQKVRNLICRDFERVFKDVDILVAPTSPNTALKIGASINDPLFGELQDVLVEPSTLAGLPGVNLPCGFIDGLPVGMQIIGPQFREDMLFEAGFAYEQEAQWYKMKPPLAKPVVSFISSAKSAEAPPFSRQWRDSGGPPLHSSMDKARGFLRRRIKPKI
ncbi:MAG: Asp-tRNA(Asn)/Glu-tRNA(Gln) amidotransferase subunit GatA [bacterium]|nr:Asp-tRNA(Asn)/Glu-tRNA(Gln) amidotransferase subunit GatA [bacterium]